MPEEVVKSKTKRAYHKTSETQKVIFDTAMSLMSEKGFQGTTVREICAKVNIPIGTFYNCYKSKMDILKVVYDEGDKYIGSIVSEFEGKDAAEQLNLFVKYYAKLNINTGIEVMRVLFYPTNEWFAKTRPMQELVISIIENGQKNGQLKSEYDAKHIMHYIFDILRGVCYNWCIFNGDFDMEKRLEEHMSLICGVLKTESK